MGQEQRKKRLLPRILYINVGAFWNRKLKPFLLYPVV